MALWSWSKTPASNSNADTTINWAEGQAPSSVNDSARAMMARIAEYRDDMAGAIVTGGIVNQYTVSSSQGFDTLAHLSGQAIAFSPHLTNTGPVQINIDGLGLKPYRPSPGVDFIGGELIQGTPYVGVYNNSTGEIYAQGCMSSPYSVPLGAGLDFWGATAPNSAFAFPMGQQISIATYAKLYALFGPNRYGTDTGSLFFLPDKTGRVSAMKEATATRLTSAGAGVDGSTIGSAGGAQTTTLALANLPNYNPSWTGIPSGTTVLNYLFAGNLNVNFNNGTGSPLSVSGGQSAGQVVITPQGGVGSINGGVTQTAVNKLPPLIVCNYIIRIL
jgi:microcystin-dependent protein